MTHRLRFPAAGLLLAALAAFSAGCGKSDTSDSGVPTAQQAQAQQQSAAAAAAAAKAQGEAAARAAAAKGAGPAH